MRSVLIGSIAVCLTIAAVFWQRPPLRQVPPATMLASTPTVDQGTVRVGSKLEKHWSNWNGTVALFSHRTAVPHDETELARGYLLIPSFTYGSFDAVAAANLTQQATGFAADANLRLEQETRQEFFHARFMSDPKAIALVPESLSTALGMDSAASIQRLALVQRD